VFACSLITNKCIVDYGSDIDTNHEEVIEVGLRRAEDLKQFVTKMIVKMSTI